MTITGSFERFQNYVFKINFLENESLFQKTGVPLLRTKIANATFSYKTSLSEVLNVKTNTMGSIKWILRKERRFVSHYFFFDNFVSVKEPLTKS